MTDCRICNSTIPTSIKIEGKVRKLNRRVHCLECVPFGTRPSIYKTKTQTPLTREEIQLESKLCSSCKECLPPDKFYKRGRGGLTHYCKKCSKNYVRDRQRKQKQRGVELKGGCCSECGYNKCIAALDFHHIDSDSKEFNLNVFGRKPWKLIEAELKKCVLLCANCHREAHHNKHP